jgi:hypothetical protein
MLPSNKKTSKVPSQPVNPLEREGTNDSIWFLFLSSVFCVYTLSYVSIVDAVLEKNALQNYHDFISDGGTEGQAQELLLHSYVGYPEIIRLSGDLLEKYLGVETVPVIRDAIQKMVLDKYNSDSIGQCLDQGGEVS